VNGKRKSYKASSRRQRKREDGTEELGDFSDEEDGESLERKLARLRREIEEVKEEFTKRRLEKEKTEKKQDQLDQVAVQEDAASLSKMLDSISENYRVRGGKPGVALAQALKTTLKSSGSSANTVVPRNVSGEATYTVTYAPHYQQSHALAKAADFDTRLTLLEKTLGIASTVIPALDFKGVPITVLPTLDILQRQVSVLAESSPSSLDSISRRVRALIQEVEKLDEARRSAKAAQDELRVAGGDAAMKGDEIGDSEQEAKVNALYGTLATIENLSPLLPSLLDRLRSLRAIHADAAMASQNLERLAKRQEEMATDIRKWREGLEKVEEAMERGETVIGGNMKVVEGWVKDLEKRMSKLAS
jgi:nuclear migration protein JNM1